MVVLRVISGGYEGIGGGTVLVALMRKVVGIGEGGGKGGKKVVNGSKSGEWWGSGRVCVDLGLSC